MKIYKTDFSKKLSQKEYRDLVIWNDSNIMTFGKENESLDPRNVTDEVLQGRKCVWDGEVGKDKDVRLLECIK